MEILKDEEVLLNLKLLKRTHFYHMFDPNCKNMCNWDVTIIVLINLISQCTPILVLMGIIVQGISVLNISERSLVLLVIIHYYLSTYTLIRIVNTSKIIWDLFSFTKFDFLRSKMCAQNIKILHKYRTNAISFTNFYVVFLCFVIIQWAIFPLVINFLTRNENVNQLMQNVFNFPYPVKMHTYNCYYFVFYILEVLLVFSLGHTLLIMDTILLSFYFSIIGQYNVICQSFESIGLENKSQNEHYSDFKSILWDQQRLNLKLREFYWVVRPIVLINFAVNTGLMILLMCILCAVYFSTKSISMLMMKLVSTVIAQHAHCFLSCILFENINIQVNSVNYAMYSCNWTLMDLKFKRLLLLAIHINNANKCEFQFSPMKIVNLQLFANVVKTSFNILSVLINIIK